MTIKLPGDKDFESRPSIAAKALKINLNENSNVLIFGCEGDADEELYQKLLTE